MKGGALPSLSSRDRLPGLAVATTGLCYVPHKSSSCFTTALPHLSAGLICQAELPGKFFGSVIDTVTNSAAFLHCSFPPLIFAEGSPDALWCCWQLRVDAMVNLYCATASVIVFTEVLTSTRPHQNIASVLQLQAKQIPTTRLIVKGIHTTEIPSHFDSWCKTLTGSWKPRGNWVMEGWERDRGLRGVGQCFYSSNCILPQKENTHTHTEGTEMLCQTVTYLVSLILHPWHSFDPLNLDLSVSLRPCRHYS